MSKPITDFINNELKPRLFDYIPAIFPNMEFKRKGNKWISEHHIDGSEGTGYKADRTIIKEGYKSFWRTTKGEPTKDIFNLYMELNGINVIEAVNRLCDIVCIDKPTYTPEALEAYRKAEERRTLLEQSADRQQAALFQAEGKEVLDYLHRRGWTDEEIKTAGLGYISVEEAKTIGAQYGVGDYYTFSIPIHSGGNITSFKFRTIKAEAEQGKPKYKHLYGNEKTLFNLTGQYQQGGTMIVVESELDALLMEARGIEGVVATEGGKLTEDFLEVAKKRGINNVKLFFDNDEAGYRFTKQSIDLLRKSKIEPLVITIEDERYKDAGDFLKEHTIEELQEEIKLADYGGYYLARKVWNDFVKNEGEIYPERENNLMWEMINLANDTLREETRLDIFHFYTDNAIKHGFRRFTYEELKAIADRDRELKSTLNKAEETKKALAEITKEVDRGNIDTGLKMMSEAASTLSKIDYKVEYSDLLAPMTWDKFFNKQRIIGKDIATKYTLSNGREKEAFAIPAGAITIVAAQTSHGKSTLLQNLALQTLENKEEGVVLYFTYEEEEEAVFMQFFNKYINEALCKVSENHFISNNLGAIKHYCNNNRDLKYIRSDKWEFFEKKREDFLKEYCNSGKLQIKYGDFDSTELIRMIRYISGQTKVRAVFIDYIQLLYKNEFKAQRTEELKEICRDLKNLAVEEKLPIVVAAQFNRATTSPAKLHSQGLGEAGDLERIANKILCIWNSAFTAQDGENQKEINALAERGFNLGQGGKIYAKLTKNRGGIVNLDAIWDFNGNTGVITDNKQTAELTTEEIKDLF